MHDVRAHWLAESLGLVTQPPHCPKVLKKGLVCRPVNPKASVVHLASLSLSILLPSSVLPVGVRTSSNICVEIFGQIMIRSVFEAMDTMPLGSTCPKVEPGMEQDDDESPSVTMVGQDDYATSLSSYLDGTSASWLNQTHIDAWPTGLWSPPQSANADLAEINNLCHGMFSVDDSRLLSSSNPEETR